MPDARPITDVVAEPRTIDLDGPVSYVEHPGPGRPGTPTVILVHGLGASKLSWLDLAPRLAQTHRVLALDLVGFGDSIPRGRSSAVKANADLLGRFVTTMCDGPVTLVGNSMGGMVSVLLTRQSPDLVDRLVLLDSALPQPMAVRASLPDPTVLVMFALYTLPGVGELFLSRRRDSVSAEEQVRQLLDLVCADASRVPETTVATMVAHARDRRLYRWAPKAFLKAERSLIRTLISRRPRFSTILAELTCPTLLIHGTEDRLVDIGAARTTAAANPHMTLVELPGVGHAPQLEVPDLVLDAMTTWAGTSATT